LRAGGFLGYLAVLRRPFAARCDMKPTAHFFFFYFYGFFRPAERVERRA
jgi:hypothetical protein